MYYYFYFLLPNVDYRISHDMGHTNLYNREHFETNYLTLRGSRHYLFPLQTFLEVKVTYLFESNLCRGAENQVTL